MIFKNCIFLLLLFFNWDKISIIPQIHYEFVCVFYIPTTIIFIKINNHKDLHVLFSFNLFYIIYTSRERRK